MGGRWWHWQVWGGKKSKYQQRELSWELGRDVLFLGRR